ncbi:MAG: biopolymer transporter ExbD [Sulfurospirillaceae bacterium]|nr:biopolymer transporter ExbD [Sulfurospirillaceae bacterium]
MQLKRFDTINVVPFIDIMLVLLVIVLTTATFVSLGMIPVDLGEAKASNPMNVKKDLVITITKEGAFFFNDKAVENTFVEKELLSYDTQSPVFINCDKQASFEPFVTLLNLLKQHHYSHLEVITKR